VCVCVCVCESVRVCVLNPLALLVQAELTTFVGRILEEARQSWIKGEEPIREDGYFVSPVAYDVIQVGTPQEELKPPEQTHRDPQEELRPPEQSHM